MAAIATMANDRENLKRLRILGTSRKKFVDSISLAVAPQVML